jgi:hypothetical protein
MEQTEHSWHTLRAEVAADHHGTDLDHLWGPGMALFVPAATPVPAAETALKMVSLSGQQWVLLVGVRQAGTFRLEARNLKAPRRGQTAVPDEPANKKSRE